MPQSFVLGVGEHLQRSRPRGVPQRFLDGVSTPVPLGGNKLRSRLPVARPVTTTPPRMN